MIRFLISLLLGLLVGLAFGLGLGWGVFPTETYGNPASSLAQQYQDEYTAMIAAGFQVDGDTSGALERLAVLGVADVRLHVQQVTERYIDASRRLDDIYNLVLLADALGVLTEKMEPYRGVIAP
ncbi:MAG: hypothetical protein EA396_09595 [Anaerolineaceae bacterium]|nr:MAG: hypothetical protein EA396_09595 [Anaerolineaceae bacterium]